MLLDDELDRQTDVLVSLGYPGLAGLAEEAFRKEAEALREPLRARVGPEAASGAAQAAFVLVPGPALVPVSERVPLLRLKERAGTLSRHFADVDSFKPVFDVPDAPVYAVVDVQRGEEFCGVRPAEAAVVLAERDRTMLTMEEGLAFLHAVPEALEKNKCFHTGASRGTDRRVPALWISERAPHLGWCWEHNHHTWLGVASAASRVTSATD